MYNGYDDSTTSSTFTNASPHALGYEDGSGVSDPLTIYPSRESTDPTFAADLLQSTKVSWYPNIDLSAAIPTPQPLPSSNPVSFYRALPRADIQFPEPYYAQTRGRSLTTGAFLYAGSMPGTLGTDHAAPALPRRSTHYAKHDLHLPYNPIKVPVLPPRVPDLPPNPPLPPKVHNIPPDEPSAQTQYGLPPPLPPKVLSPSHSPPPAPAQPLQNVVSTRQQDSLRRPLPTTSHLSEVASSPASSPLPSPPSVTFPIPMASSPLPEEEEDEEFRRALLASQQSYEEAARRNAVLSSEAMPSVQLSEPFAGDVGDGEHDEDLRRAIEESLLFSEAQTVAPDPEAATSSKGLAVEFGTASPQSSQSLVSSSLSNSPAITSSLSLLAYPTVPDVVVDELGSNQFHAASYPLSSEGPTTLRKFPSFDTLSISTVTTTAQQDLPGTPDYDPLHHSEMFGPDSGSRPPIASGGPNSNDPPSPTSSLGKPVSQSSPFGSSSRAPTYGLLLSPTSPKIAPALRTSPSHNSIAVAPNNAALAEYPQRPEQLSVRPRAGSVAGTMPNGIAFDVPVGTPLTMQTLPKRVPSPSSSVRPPMPDLSRASYLGDLMQGVSFGFGQLSLVPKESLPNSAHPFPDEISCGTNEAFYIATPNFRQLLRLLASLGHASIQASSKARMAIDTDEVYLRPTLQFVRRPGVANEWATVLWFEVAVPQNRSYGGGNTSKNADTSKRAYNSALPETVVHNSKYGSQVFVCQEPLVPLPRKLPDLMMYLQNLLADSRRATDSLGLRRLSKIVDLLYPKDNDIVTEVGGKVEDPAAAGGPSSRRHNMMGMFSRVIPRGKKNTQRVTNEEVYDLVTPFRLD